jgi:hypothetical protein
MQNFEDLAAIRSAVGVYLEGMIYGQDERLRGIMHSQCMQVGHIGSELEFISRDQFIEEIKHEVRQAAGTQITYDIPMIDITGDIAIAKVQDACFGSIWTDYLTLLKRDGHWIIIMKAFYDHANDSR